jgi:hypothetical protein
MPRKLPPFVEHWRDRHGKLRYYFRRGKGKRIALPVADPRSEEFQAAYCAARASKAPQRETRQPAKPGTIDALVVSYLKNSSYVGLRDTTKKGYATRIDALRKDHGHRTVSGLTRERILTHILQPYADRPGQAHNVLKMLRILIRHAIEIGWLDRDPSLGIKRPKTKEIRAWADPELAAFEARWKLGSKQRTAYALMLYVGMARVDTHRTTWSQMEESVVRYARQKTGVAVEMGLGDELQAALGAADRSHVTILNTEFGKPFTVAGFSQFMRNAIREAGLPLDCKPHGLRKTLGRRLADAGCTAHEIMAALGHTTLVEAERYTREADRRHGGRSAARKLAAHRKNKNAQTALESLGASANRR